MELFGYIDDLINWVLCKIFNHDFDYEFAKRYYEDNVYCKRCGIGRRIKQ